MTGRRWILLTLVAFAFLIGSFFFFLGSVISLFSHTKPSGNVAVVEVLGGIYDAKPVIEELRDLKKDDKVKSVILRVDSPGGSVGASQEIFEAVRDLKQKKPVVVSMGSVAASGGYYIAAPATKIIANPGTVTGSIGVRMELMNVQDFLDWAKIRPVTLKSGKFKDAGSPFRPMTDEEKEYLQGVINGMHEQFKTAVAENRKLSRDEVNQIADGRVFTGSDALSKKLVDELGGFDLAVKIAGELGGIKGEPDLFYPIQKDKELWERLVEGSVEKIFEKVFLSLQMPVKFSYIVN